MEGCRFRYDSADSSDWLLDEVSLNVSYGSRVAIVGKNGTGRVLDANAHAFLDNGKTAISLIHIVPFLQF